MDVLVPPRPIFCFWCGRTFLFTLCFATAVVCCCCWWCCVGLVMSKQRGRDIRVESVRLKRRGHREDPRVRQAPPADPILRAGDSCARRVPVASGMAVKYILLYAWCFGGRCYKIQNTVLSRRPIRSLPGNRYSHVLVCPIPLLRPTNPSTHPPQNGRDL